MEPDALELSAFRNFQMVSEVCILFTMNPLRTSNRISGISGCSKILVEEWK
jgi:hypothetical protein